MEVLNVVGVRTDILGGEELRRDEFYYYFFLITLTRYSINIILIWSERGERFFDIFNLISSFSLRNFPPAVTIDHSRLRCGTIEFIYFFVS